MKEISSGMNSEKLISVIFQQKGMEATIAAVKKFESALNTAAQSGSKIQKVTDKFKDAAGNMRTVTSVSKDYGNTWKITSDKIKLAGEQTAKATERSNDFVNALKRAAIVAPVWMALRGAMQGVINTITEGFDTIVKFNNELLRIKATLPGNLTENTKEMGKIKNEIEDLANTSGVSFDKIAKSVYRFTTVGLSKDVALAGAKTSVEMSRAMVSDNPEQVAESLAMAYKTLGDTLDKTLTPQENFKRLSASIFELFKTNAFELPEMTESLRNFIATANTSNISLRTAIAMLGALSTGAMKASSAGRLLSTTIMKFGQEHKSVGEMLGFTGENELDIEKEEFFTVFDKFMKKLSEADTYTKLDVLEKLGGTRNTQALQTLLTVYTELKDNIKIMNPILEEQNKQIKNFDSQLKNVNDSIGVQVERAKVIKANLGRNFLVNLVGGDEENISNVGIVWNATLQLINAGLEKVGKTAHGTADNIREAFGDKAIQLLGKGIKEIAAGALNKKVIEPTSGTISQAQIDLWIKEDEEAQKLVKLQKENHELSKKTTEKYKEQNQELSKQERLRLKLAEETSKHYQKIAGLFGANDVQKAALDYLYSVENKTNDLIEKRRNLELAITEQKLKQSYYNSEEMKIYEIAQKYGPDLANKMSKYLKMAPGEREKGKKDPIFMNLLKTMFPDRYEQISAKDYFSSKEGKKVLYSPAEITPLSKASEAVINSLNINMESNIKIKINDKEFDAVVEESIVKRLKNNKSKLSNAVNQKINEA